MKTSKQFLSLAAVAALGIAGTSIGGATVITPTGAVSTVGNLSGRPTDATIDGSGLSGVGDILTQSHSVTGDPTNDLYWIGPGTIDIQLDFDLGGTFDVDRMHLWNYVPTNNTTNRGLGVVDIYFSTDNGTTYSLTPVTVSFAQAVANTPAPPETQTFAAVSGVTDIRLIADNSGSGTHTAFMEIRFGEAGPADIIPPTWTASWPQVDSATATGFTARARIDENGTAYYVVVADGAAAPSVAQVKAGEDSTGSSALASGSIALVADTENTDPVTGFAADTAYDVWFVAEDGAPNLQAAPVKVDAATGLPDTTPPTWTASWPQVDSATATGFTARGRIDENGAAYYVVVADGAAAPSVAQVKAGEDSTGSSALASGSIALVADAENTDPVTGLAADTAYDVWFVAEDGVPNLQAAPVKVDAATTAIPAVLVAADLNDGGTDTGFDGGFYDGSSNVFITEAPDLTYANYGIAQTGLVQKVYSSNAGPDRQDLRNLATPMSGEIWFSILVNIPAGSNYAGLTFNSYGNTYDPITTDARILLTPSQLQVGFNGEATTTATGTFDAGTTHLLLGQMNIVAGNDTLNVWVDPNLNIVGGPGGLPAANFTSTDIDFTDSIANIGVAGRKGGGSDVSADAIRVSNTVTAFEDVTGVSGPGILFAITAIEYAPDADPVPTVTLTWRKTGAASYIAKVSTDMSDWSGDLDDGIVAERDENPGDTEHITVTFPLDGVQPDTPELFFRIEEG